MDLSSHGGHRIPGLFILSLLIGGLISACSGSSGREAQTNAQRQEKPAEAVATITVARAEARQVPFFIQATGSLVANEQSDVAPKVAGKVVNVSANVGEFVGQGEVIAKIDDQDARLRLAQARAGVTEAKARVTQAQSRVTQAISAVRQAEARLGLSQNGRFDSSSIPEVRAAQANYEQLLAEFRQAEANEKRYRELVETGDVSMVQYEGFRTARDTARARVNAARQQLEATVNTARQNNQTIRSAEAAVETARTEVEGAKAQVTAAQTQVATAEQSVTDTVVRAPFAGFLSNRPVAVGEYVTSASIIATILRTNPIKAQIRIAEADVPTVVIGRGISIQVDAYKDRNFAGTVTAVNPSVDVESRSATVEALVENGNNALRAGMFVTARINREGGSSGVFVPAAAVLNDQATQSQRVFVIQDNVAKLRTVQLGSEENGFFQILSGVNADELVATSNLPQLFEGAQVQIAPGG